jgi:hypothetical protein
MTAAVRTMPTQRDGLLSVQRRRPRHGGVPGGRCDRDRVPAEFPLRADRRKGFLQRSSHLGQPGPRARDRLAGDDHGGRVEAGGQVEGVPDTLRDRVVDVNDPGGPVQHGLPFAEPCETVPLGRRRGKIGRPQADRRRGGFRACRGGGPEVARPSGGAGSR